MDQHKRRMQEKGIAESAQKNKETFETFGIGGTGRSLLGVFELSGVRREIGRT